MDAESTVDIVAQPRVLSADDARSRVERAPMERLRSVVSTREPVAAELRYKPFYAFPVVLTKRVFMGEDDVTEGRILVDGLTDISRPFTREDIEEEEISVPVEQVIEPEVTEDEAQVTANSRRMQVEHKEGGKLEMESDPTMVYKPVWLVELANGDVRVVSATDGQVFSGLLFG